MNPYQTNPDLAKPFGRDAVLAEVRALLDRPTPSHVSIVGPRSMGKTLLLRALTERARGWGRFVAVAPWDVRRHTPRDDEAFFAGFAAAVGESLHEAHPDLAGLLRDEPSIGMIQDVFGELESDGSRVLLVVDHLDRALRQPEISKDLWDNLRDLTKRGALVLVTATQEPLRELMTADTRASQFWNVFADPIMLSPFSEADLDAFLAPLQGEKGVLSPPARKEFERQTGGVPLLCTLVACDLYVSPNEGVEKADVSGVAAALAQTSQHVGSLWDDIPAPVQGVLVEVTSRGEEGVPVVDVSRHRRGGLVARGYVRESSAQRLVPAARMMLDHAARHEASAGDLARLFGSGSDADTHTRALLQLRIEAVDGGTPELRSDIERAVRDLFPQPVRALGSLRDFAHTALDAVWDAHYPDRALPRGVVDAWYRRGLGVGEEAGDPARREDRVPLPSGRYARSEQEKILRLLTDPAEQWGGLRLRWDTSVSSPSRASLATTGSTSGTPARRRSRSSTAAAACVLGRRALPRLVEEMRGHGIPRLLLRWRRRMAECYPSREEVEGLPGPPGTRRAPPARSSPRAPRRSV